MNWTDKVMEHNDESTELVESNVREIAPQAPATPMTLLQQAISANMSPEQLGQFMDLQDRHEAKLAKSAYISAISRFQAECPTIKKTGTADRYTYAPLDEVLRTIRPILDKHGLSVRFDTEATEGKITAFCKVSHVSGHEDISRFTCDVDTKMRVNDAQKQASANSYARRYALMNALNLVASNEDDDGFGTAEFISAKQAVTLRDELAACGADEALFCKWMKVEELEDIILKDWSKAQRGLEAKQKAAQS
jgi:hypothetical protein